MLRSLDLTPGWGDSGEEGSKQGSDLIPFVSFKHPYGLQQAVWPLKSGRGRGSAQAGGREREEGG